MDYLMASLLLGTGGDSALCAQDAISSLGVISKLIRTTSSSLVEMNALLLPKVLILRAGHNFVSLCGLPDAQHAAYHQDQVMRFVYVLLFPLVKRTAARRLFMCVCGCGHIMHEAHNFATSACSFQRKRQLIKIQVWRIKPGSFNRAMLCTRLFGNNIIVLCVYNKNLSPLIKLGIWCVKGSYDNIKSATLLLSRTSIASV